MSYVELSKMLALFALAFVLVVNGAAAQAQQRKIPTIGWAGVAASGSRIEIFRRELRDLGYFEDKNITIAARSADDKLDRLPVLTDELLRLGVDVLVVPSTSGPWPPRRRRARLRLFL